MVMQSDRVTKAFGTRGPLGFIPADDNRESLSGGRHYHGGPGPGFRAAVKRGIMDFTILGHRRP